MFNQCPICYDETVQVYEMGGQLVCPTCFMKEFGGDGSGNFDHEGRPGEVGGSGEGGEGKVEKQEVFRSGRLVDVRGTGIFLSGDKKQAEQYLTTGSGNKELKSYYIAKDLKLKEAKNRWQLIREIDPSFDKGKTYDRLIKEGFKDKLSPEIRLQNIVEKKIKIGLEKQGFAGVTYKGDTTTDQDKEFQIFDIKDIKEQ